MHDQHTMKFRLGKPFEDQPHRVTESYAGFAVVGRAKPMDRPNKSHLGAVRGATGSISARSGRRARTRLPWIMSAAITCLIVLLPSLLQAVDTSPERSVEAHGERFPAVAKIEGADGRVDAVPLRSTGLLRYRLLFRVYVGALYAPEDVALSEVVAADRPKRLELAYLYDIDAADLVRGGRTLLERQNSPETLASLADRLDRIDSAYTDVRVGDRYALDYHPDVGTTLLKNGEPVVTIEGHDFSVAYFRIWLDAEDPLSRGFRDELLKP